MQQIRLDGRGVDVVNERQKIGADGLGDVRKEWRHIDGRTVGDERTDRMLQKQKSDGQQSTVAKQHRPGWQNLRIGLDIRSC